MTLQEFRKYLERRIAFYKKEQERFVSEDTLQVEDLQRAVTLQIAFEAILNTYLHEVLEINEKDA